MDEHWLKLIGQGSVVVVLVYVLWLFLNNRLHSEAAMERERQNTARERESREKWQERYHELAGKYDKASNVIADMVETFKQATRRDDH